MLSKYISALNTSKPIKLNMSVGHAPSKHFYTFFFFFFSLRNVGQTWAATISDALISTMIKTVVIVVGQTKAATFFCRQLF